MFLLVEGGPLRVAFALGRVDICSAADDPEAIALALVLQPSQLGLSKRLQRSHSPSPYGVVTGLCLNDFVGDRWLEPVIYMDSIGVRPPVQKSQPLRSRYQFAVLGVGV